VQPQNLSKKTVTDSLNIQNEETVIGLRLRYSFDAQRVSTDKLALSPLFPLYTTLGHLAYNHNYKFSTGSRFDVDISELVGAQKFMAYDFVTSMYPEHTTKLKDQLRSSETMPEDEGLWYLVQHQPSSSSMLQASEKKIIGPCNIENLVKVSNGLEKSYYEYLEGLAYLRQLDEIDSVDEDPTNTSHAHFAIPGLFAERHNTKSQ
jgi:hypothetical protein